MAGTWAQPLAAMVANFPMLNAWRILQSGGKISPGFRWTEPGRVDDPQKVLEEEGLRFDPEGHADPEQFMGAEELADAAGLDVDDAAMAARRKKGKLSVGAASRPFVKAAQLEFFGRVRDYGLVNASNIATWRKPRPQHWYDVGIGDNRGQISLMVNSRKKIVTALFWINHDKDLYAQLLAQREAIESDLGFALEWDDKPERKASKLVISRHGDFLDEAQSQELVEWLVTMGDGFARVLPKYL
ncbi:DUF4268 domain-containing protein [Paeniglutamicibacter psychrophenolicus]|uniref:DUF4268 domain-containing protein n=1 Tax=Paeniglutamicibacter psychrophenolicus TaxID=257454 RepID=UPI002783787E|nr:DUF4268 domain-containing protein [Paeniglutamicibacter psychrophenolicus]MDQ0094883.1 hypothetical protein [Paeniglutamicibacter psychrophenolicus]